jgi:hypothetical protein
LCYSLPKLDTAILANGRLLDCFHLALQAAKFRSIAFVAADEKRCGPKDD